VLGLLLTAAAARSCQVAQNDLEAEGGGVRGPLGLDDPVLGSDAPGLEPLLQGAHGVRLVAAPAHRVWFFSSQFGVVAVIGWSVGRHPGPEVVGCVEGVGVRLLGVDCGATEDKVRASVLLMVLLVADLVHNITSILKIAAKIICFT